MSRKCILNQHWRSAEKRKKHRKKGNETTTCKGFGGSYQDSNPKTVQVLSADDKPTDDSLRFLVYAPIDTRSKFSTLFQFERVNNELSEYTPEIDFCFPVEKCTTDNKYRLI